MSARPLALGAGAGSLSSILAAFLTHQLHSSPPDPFLHQQFVDTAGPLIEEPKFWLGLFLGVIIGILLGAFLDLLYLWKQHLSLTLRNRLASLQLRRA